MATKKLPLDEPEINFQSLYNASLGIASESGDVVSPGIGQATKLPKETTFKKGGVRRTESDRPESVIEDTTATTDTGTGGAATETGGETGGETAAVDDVFTVDLSEFEMNDKLFDLRLQNVFDSYQKNIGILSQKEQQAVQEAYYVREMSKKYLGEYASDNGIGDVSGSLLDIYGEYQKNLSGIRENYDALEMNLDQEYQASKQATVEDILKNQYNMDVAKMDAVAAEVFHNITTGSIPNGMTEDEYLEMMRPQLRTEDLQMIEQGVYSGNLKNAQDNLLAGNYGEFDNANDYINSLEGQFSETDFATLRTMGSVAAFDAAKIDVSANLAMGRIPAGMTEQQYLESVRSTLRPADYQEISATLYADTYKKVGDNIAAGNFAGYATAAEYLASYDGYFSESDMTSLTGGADSADREETYNVVANNITIGNIPAGMTSQQYLDSMRTQLNPEDYRTLNKAIYDTTVAQIGADLENGVFGEYATAGEYLESYRDYLSAEDYAALSSDVQSYELDLAVETVRSDIRMNKIPAGMTKLEYLASVEDTLRDTDYAILYEEVYSQTYSKVLANITSENPIYGYKTVNGQQVRITTAEDYLAQYAGVLHENDLAELTETIQFINDAAQDEVDATTAHWLKDPAEQGTDFYQPNYDASYYLDTSRNSAFDGVGSQPDVYRFPDQDMDFVRIKDAVGSNAEVNRLERQDLDDAAAVVPSDLTTYFNTTKEDGEILSDNTIINYEDTGMYYVYKGNKWYRLVSGRSSFDYTSVSNDMMTTWDASVAGGAFKANGGAANTIEYNGLKYVENRTDERTLCVNDIAGLTNATDKAFYEGLFDAFLDIHPNGTGGIKQDTAIFYQGQFWTFTSGKLEFVPMKKK